ncbi:MAG TPA: SpoIID/LytB domain-containing protein [Frankiaceae bacterium]|nr:SpoIID/LytB domain-containing protein [Frankiaceae bacterium]
MRRYAAALAAVTVASGVALAALPVASASAVTASQTFVVPANGVFNITGHGWGHGHGLSQWGAQGAASLGIPSSTIVSTYYPGTTASVLANTPIRVRLTATNSFDLAVLPAAGLTVTDGAGRKLGLTAPATYWRILADSTGQHLQRYVAGNWYGVAVGGATNLTTPVRFTDTANLVSVVYPGLYSRDYRGSVASWLVGASTVINTDTLTMEDYLRGVVPQESSPSWYPAALQAQAIAARTYAAQQRASASIWSTYDICDSSACQAFGGTRLRSSTGVITPVEYPSTDAAIAATAGQIRTYGGLPAFTQFSSSNGGFSVAGGQPYLVAKADPWDGAVPNSMHTWTATLPVSTIQAYYPSVGKLQRLVVTSRDGNGDWGGRINTVVLQGVDSLGHATSVTTTGSALYGIRPFGAYSDGLRSTWWTITNGAPVTAPPPTPPPAKKPYAATLISSPGAITMAANGYAFVTLRWRNDGTSAWPIDGATQLGTDLPELRNSLSSGWGWLSDSRPGTLTADAPGAKSVLPGQTASISFVLWGDSRAKGVTTEAFQPFRYFTAWFGGAANIRITRT